MRRSLASANGSLVELHAELSDLDNTHFMGDTACVAGQVVAAGRAISEWDAAAVIAKCHCRRNRSEE